MPKEAQQLTTLSYVDFTGGMNSAVPATSLGDNEYQLIKNMEFNFNKLCTRGGLSGPLASFTSDIMGVYFDEGSKNYLVVLTNKSVYAVSSDFSSVVMVGEIAGSSKPVFCDFDNKVFVASGGKLQYYDDTKKKIVKINSSYDCDNVYERFGRLATTVDGDDNIYYSSVGDPYETKTVKTVTVNSDGTKTTTVIEEADYVDKDDVVTNKTSTSTAITTITAAVAAVFGNPKADALNGSTLSAGTTASSRKQHVIKIVKDYDNTDLVSTTYYLDDVQSDEISIDDLTYNDFIFGSKPATSGYLPVSDTKDLMYGSVYRDTKDTSNNVTRTYYFDKQYALSDSSVYITYKLDSVKNSSGTETAKELSVAYLKVNLGEDAAEFNDEYCVVDGKDNVTSVSYGKKTERKSTVIIFTNNSLLAKAVLYFKTRTITDTTTTTSSTINAGKTIADNNGYKVGDTYSGVVNKTVSSGVINNSDGTTTEFSTIVDRNGKVTRVTRTVVEKTHTETNSSVDHSAKDRTITTISVDNGSSVATTTKDNIVLDEHKYVVQGTVFTGTYTATTNTVTDASAKSTTVTTTYTSGWKENTNDDSSSKFVEIGYKDDGNILKALPISGDVAVFKNNGRVYSLSNEFPDWSVSQIAEHTDVINKEAIVVVGSDIAFMTKFGLKTLTTTATYGNFTTNEIARKINRSVAQSVYNPIIFHLVRKRQLIIVPDTSNDDTRKVAYCYQYDIGAGVEMEFGYPIYDMQETDDGVIIAAKNMLVRWSFDYADDNGQPIEQAIVSKKYVSSRSLYTRMVDIGVIGTAGDIVTMEWANKKINYSIPDKRRMIHVFSVCDESEFKLYTAAKISLEYIKLYVFEQ